MKPTKTSVARELAQKIDVHLRRFERSPEINVTKCGTRRRFYGACAIGDRHRVRVVYINYQGGDHLSVEDATKYLAWLDAGNVGQHYKALMESAK